MEADTEQERIYSRIKSKVRSLLLLLISAVLQTGVTASIPKTGSYCRNAVVREQRGEKSETRFRYVKHTWTQRTEGSLNTAWNVLHTHACVCA